MIKKTKCAFFLATALFSCASFAATHLLKPNMTLYFNFTPNEPEVIKNPIWWEISADCTIQSEDATNDLSALMLRNSGKVNGIELSENSSLIVSVHSQSILSITADAYAWVQITNVGENKNTVRAVCTSK